MLGRRLSGAPAGVVILLALSLVLGFLMPLLEAEACFLILCENGRCGGGRWHVFSNACSKGVTWLKAFLALLRTSKEIFWGVLRWHSGIGIWRCHCCGSGYCYGSGLIPVPRTSMCHQCSQKKKRRKAISEVRAYKANWIQQCPILSAS